MNENTIYTETQTFLNKWIWLLIGQITIFGIYQLFIEYQALEPIIFPILLWVGIIAILVLVKLQTTIDLDGIHVKFFPFIIGNKSFLWEDIDAVYVRKYTAWEFGGWGYRISGSGVAYSTSGFYGIQLKLKSGRRILVGTHNPKKVQILLTKLNPDEQKEIL